MNNGSRAYTTRTATFLRPALFALLSFLFVSQVAICIEGLKIGAGGRADFRHLYTAGYIVRSGQRARLYDYPFEISLQSRVAGPGPLLPFNRPPVEALFFLLFSFWSYRTAYFLFAAFNVILLGAAQWLIRSEFSSLRELGVLVPEALIFCYLPAAIALCLGQDSILLFAVFAAASMALRSGKELSAGLLISLGLFKFQLILPVALLFLLWRRWRFVSGVTAGAVCWFIVSVWLVGLSGLHQLSRRLLDMSVDLSQHGNAERYSTFPDQMPNIRGFLFTITGGRAPNIAMHAAILICSVALIWIAARRAPSFPLAVAVAVLVSYHGLVHDSLLLVLPLGVWLSQGAQMGDWRLISLTLATFVFPVLAFGLLHNRFSLEVPLLLALMWATGETTVQSRVMLPIPA